MDAEPADRRSDAEPESLTEIAESLLVEAQRMRVRWEELDALLATLDVEEPSPPRSSEPTRTRPTQEDPARLLMMELARDGSSRAEATEYLERTFGLQLDPKILDEIFPGQPG